MIQSKTKSIISLLLTVWIVLFLMASTSHMDLSHYYSLHPDNQLKIVLHDESNRDNSPCPWANAVLMTQGYTLQTFIFYNLHICHFVNDYQQQLFVENIYTYSEPRGPPTKLI